MGWLRFGVGGWGLRGGREKVLDWDLGWDFCLLGCLECPGLDFGGWGPGFLGSAGHRCGLCLNECFRYCCCSFFVLLAVYRNLIREVV